MDATAAAAVMLPLWQSDQQVNASSVWETVHAASSGQCARCDERAAAALPSREPPLVLGPPTTSRCSCTPSWASLSLWKQHHLQKKGSCRRVSEWMAQAAALQACQLLSRPWTAFPALQAELGGPPASRHAGAAAAPPTASTLSPPLARMPGLAAGAEEYCPSSWANLPAELVREILFAYAPLQHAGADRPTRYTLWHAACFMARCSLNSPWRAVLQSTVSGMRACCVARQCPRPELSSRRITLHGLHAPFPTYPAPAGSLWDALDQHRGAVAAGRHGHPLPPPAVPASECWGCFRPRQAHQPAAGRGSPAGLL